MLIGVKMALVFVLLGGTLWYLRRHDRSALISARRSERPVALLAQAKVGKTSSVALVRIGGDAYAVGVTEQSVTLLLDTPVVTPESVSANEDDGDESPLPTTAAVPPATLVGAVRSLVGRRSRVEYLDVALPVQTAPRSAGSPAPGTDGSGSSPSARKPEPMRRR